jgi:nitrogen fixation protein NifB
MVSSPSQQMPSSAPSPCLSLRVAVATTGRGIVDHHFGHADRFEIYDVDAEHAVFCETRRVVPYCQGGHGDHDDLAEIIQTLQDCQAVLVTKIGVGPDDVLRAAGIEPVQDYDAIGDALFRLYNTWVV